MPYPAFLLPLPLPLSARPNPSHQPRLLPAHPCRMSQPPSSSSSNSSSNSGSSNKPYRHHASNPANHPSHLSQSDFTRALSLSTRPDKRPARAAFRSATETHPLDARLWLAWAQMEARVGRFAMARCIFKRGVDIHSRNVKLLHAWAVMEGKGGHVEQARLLFKRCLTITRKDGLVWQSWALLEERNGHLKEARRLFGEGVREDGGSASLWNAWGVLESRCGRLEVSCQLFKRAVEVDASHIRSLQAWAIVEEKLGRFDNSRTLFESALSIDGGSAPTCQAYGLFEARRGSLEKARLLFKKGIEIDTNHAPIWHAWAVMEQKERNYEKARDLFDRGVEAAPNSTPMLRAWASMELELGHIDKSGDWNVPRRGFKDSARRGRVGQRNERNKFKGGEKQISRVGENLRILRLMIERRSDEDVSTVMQWLDSRARADRKLYDALAQRTDNDSRKVKEWVERRSSSDIDAFALWLDEMYKKDSRIGVYIFNWDIASTATGPSAPISLPVPAHVSEDENIEKPVEWLLLSERPKKSLQEFDQELFANGIDYGELYPGEIPVDFSDAMYFLESIAETFADRAALTLALGAMTIVITFVSLHLINSGYSPGAGSHSIDEEIPAVLPPTGVDAHLYDVGNADNWKFQPPHTI